MPGLGAKASLRHDLAPGCLYLLDRVKDELVRTRPGGRPQGQSRLLVGDLGVVGTRVSRQAEHTFRPQGVEESTPYGFLDDRGLEVRYHRLGRRAIGEAYFYRVRRVQPFDDLVQLSCRQPPELLVPFGFVSLNLIVVEQSPSKEGENSGGEGGGERADQAVLDVCGRVVVLFSTVCSSRANKTITMPTTKVSLRPPDSKRSPRSKSPSRHRNPAQRLVLEPQYSRAGGARSPSRTGRLTLSKHATHWAR